MNINWIVERFLREYDMPATKFGRLAARDPRLVLDMRMGRELRPKMCEKVKLFIQRYKMRGSN